MLALLIPGLHMGGGQAAALVEVPDVVGETQAAGTATLEGEGFVVAVLTTFSDSVPAGSIISQDPIGGSFAASGSTVTIAVSLGPQSETEERPAGGWAFHNDYQAELQRRRRRE